MEEPCVKRKTKNIYKWQIVRDIVVQQLKGWEHKLEQEVDSWGKRRRAASSADEDNRLAVDQQATMRAYKTHRRCMRNLMTMIKWRRTAGNKLHFAWYGQLRNNFAVEWIINKLPTHILTQAQVSGEYRWRKRRRRQKIISKCPQQKYYKITHTHMVHAVAIK